MTSSALKTYLEMEVLTATPQKLQLMLIDGAMRFIGRARHGWRTERYDEASEALIRAQQVVGQLVAALDNQIAPELTQKVAAVYLFVFRTLVEAHLHRDETKLDEALRVLEIERQTWRQLCEQGIRGGEDPEPGLPNLVSDPLGAGDLPSGLSLEA